MRLLLLLFLASAGIVARYARAQGPADPGDTRLRRPDRTLSVPTLLEALKDRDEEVRARAAEDLGKVEPPPVSAVPALIRALKDRSPSVRNRAAETLERIGTPKARKAVLKYRRKLGKEKAGW